MEEARNVLLTARLASGLSQRQLAARAGTSGATVAAYESGAKEPRMSTLARLVAATGSRLVVDVDLGSRHAELTREQRRSLALHRAVAARLARDPETVRAKARSNLATMRAANPGANPWLDQWAELLEGPVDHVVRVLLSPDPEARELRQNSPFAGVLTAAERQRVLDRRP